MIALVAVFVVVPFEVGFVESPEVPDATDPLWIFNRVIDFLVCCHAALCHRTALWTDERSGEHCCRATDERWRCGPMSAVADR
jgi:hypothetical protein